MLLTDLFLGTQNLHMYECFAPMTNLNGGYGYLKMNPQFNRLSCENEEDVEMRKHVR